MAADDVESGRLGWWAMSEDEGKAVEESAKAVQEVAKASQKAMELAEKAGPFLGKIFGPLVENAVGIASDRLGYYRLVQFYRLQEKVERELGARGIAAPKPVPPKIAVPLLEAATVEDNEELHTLWAQLLTNFMDPNFEGTRKRALVTILRELEPTDVAVLAAIYNTAVQQQHNIDERLYEREKIAEAVEITQQECELALLNLMRNGCILPGSVQSSGVTIGDHAISSYKGTKMVQLSLLGFEMAKACLSKGAEP